MGIVEATIWTVSILATMGFAVFGGAVIYSLATSGLSRTHLAIGTILVMVISMIIAVLWLVGLGVI